MKGKFYFNGLDSSTLGIYIVGINSSEDTIPLFGGQSYISQDVILHDYETFIRTKKENLRLSLYFTLLDNDDDRFTSSKLYALGKFFARSIPFELRLEEDIMKVIRVVPTGGIELVRFGEMKGYFQITFQATTPYWMTPMDVQTFNLSSGAPNNVFSVFNGRNIQDRFGNYDIYPKIEIRFGAKTAPNFHLTQGAHVVTLNNFVGNDLVTMHHKIVTSVLDPNRVFHNWNKNPFFLTEGNNTLTVNNNCVIRVFLQYPIFC